MQIVATTQNQPTTGLIMKIGRRAYAVESLAQASDLFCAARDKSGMGASKTPTPLLFNADGSVVGYVSYNGRVWPGHPRHWNPDAKPLHSPA